MRSVDLHTEAVIVKGRGLLEDSRFLQVYFNERTGTTAFALIEDDPRIWGVDYDEGLACVSGRPSRPTRGRGVNDAPRCSSSTGESLGSPVVVSSRDELLRRAAHDAGHRSGR